MLPAFHTKAPNNQPISNITAMIYNSDLMIIVFGSLNMSKDCASICRKINCFLKIIMTQMKGFAVLLVYFQVFRVIMVWQIRAIFNQLGEISIVSDCISEKIFHYLRH